MSGKKRRLAAYLAAGAGLALAVWALWPGLTVRQYTIESDRLTQGQRIRLVLASDLHSRAGTAQQQILDEIEKSAPDVILLPGDIADDREPLTPAVDFVRSCAAIAPTFYVTGNHEHRAENLDEILHAFSAAGAQILQGRLATISIGSTVLTLAGLDDPSGYLTTSVVSGEIPSSWQQTLNNLSKALPDEGIRILLSHRPERVEAYADSGFDLVVAGHAHGGQVRIPLLVNGLFAPNQGFFPQYAGGVYELGQTTLVVGRGLSFVPKLPRVWNPPELVIIDLIEK